MTDLHPHRPEWVRWLPAALLSIIIAAVVITSLVISPRLLAGPGPAESDQVDDLNWSLFTDEGLTFIEAARTPRIDLSDPPIEASRIGLPSDGTLAVGPHVTDLDYRLVLIVREGATRGALFTTPQFSITSNDDVVTAIRVEERGAFDFRDAFVTVSARSADFGYTPPASARLAEAVSQSRESGEPVTVRSSRGTDAGIAVTAEVTCFGAGYCLVSYIVTPPVG